MRKASSVWKSSLKRLGLGQSRKSHGRMRPARTLRYEALEARELLSVCYVDAGDGNDSWNGLYPYHTSGNNGPWRSIGKVNNARLEGGDYVLFQRGEVWQGEQLIPKSGSWGKPITYAAYGTGAKPVFRGSSQLNSTSHWINLGNNRWLTQPVFNADVGNIVFNQGPSCGVRKWSQAGLAKQGDFYVHRVAPFPFYKAILYSTSNPAVYYTDIQMALKRDIISQGGKSNITYRNLDLRYGAAHGIGGGDVHQITVLDCDFSYLGGGLDPETERRYGNGIEFWGDASGCIVDRCKFWQIYDAAITNQYVGDSPCTQYKIGYRNNIIRQCEYSFEFFADAGSTVRPV
jgi:hypothetical protein